MTYLNGIVHSHRKTLKKKKGGRVCVWGFFFSFLFFSYLFFQLEMFDVCTTGDTAHMDMIFKFLLHACQRGCIDILHCCNDPCL